MQTFTMHLIVFKKFVTQVGIASKTLGGGGNQMLPLPEKALSESMEKGGRKMQGDYKLEPLELYVQFMQNGISAFKNRKVR